jgi:hypothetical protein
LEDACRIVAPRLIWLRFVSKNTLWNNIASIFIVEADEFSRTAWRRWTRVGRRLPMESLSQRDDVGLWSDGEL